jgi:hypothetical protein
MLDALRPVESSNRSNGTQVHTNTPLICMRPASQCHSPLFIQGCAPHIHYHPNGILPLDIHGVLE